MCNAINLTGISLKYSERPILNDVNLKIKKGTITGITGESGSGKTSLLRIINGHIYNDANVNLLGDITIFDQPFDSEYIYSNAIIASIYQDPDTQIVFPNALDEIVFGMENHRFTKEQMDNQLAEFSESLGISHLLQRNPNKLSGGEKQLVVLAAMLCINPKILLLDECISQVDNSGKARVKKVLKDSKENDTTIIMVEHNPDNLEIADNIYHLADYNLMLQQKEH